jgi:hypothetical protein
MRYYKYKDKVKEEEMGRACSTNGSVMHMVIRWESQKKRDHCEDKNVGRRIILAWISREIGWSRMHWIQLAQDRDQWRGLVNMIVNLLVP